MKTLTAFAAAFLVAATAGAQVYLDVTLRQKALMVRDRNNRTLASWEISPGLPNHPTPAGNFHIRKIVWNPAWVPPKAGWAKGKKPEAPNNPKNPMKVVKIFFKEPDLYIHGTADEEALGYPASHGCIRMAPGDAYALAKTLMQNGGVPKNDAWYQNTIEDGKTVTIILPRPVGIHIGT